MISLFFVCLASFFNACMDKMSWHFEKSCFSEMDPKFWNPNISWQYAKKVFGYKIDSWHISKSLMIISMVCAIVCYKCLFNEFVDILLYGCVWNLVFNIYFNKVLIK